MNKKLILSLATSALIAGGSLVFSSANAETAPTPTAIPSNEINVEPSAASETEKATGVENKAENKKKHHAKAKKDQKKQAGKKEQEKVEETAPAAGESAEPAAAE